MRAKPVTQQRSVDKRDRILKALDALLQRKPFSAINVADLARQAKVSPATIYQRFSNEDATASVLLELYYHKVEAWARRPRASAAQAPASLFDALVAVAADGYAQVEALGYVMRPAYLYSRYRPERAGADWDRLQRAAVAGFTAFLRRYEAELGTKDVERAGSLLAYLYNMLLLGPLLHGEADWKVLRNRNAFARTVATVAHRYLVAAE